MNTNNQIDQINLFTFWEGARPPAYIDMCIATWFNNIPNLKLTVINYENIDAWIGEYVDIDELKKYSFAMQSDVVSSIILAKHGGVFIDADSIITDNIDKKFLTEENGRLKAFGIPKLGQFHVAILSARKHNPSVVYWMNEACKRVNSKTSKYQWNFLAGDILEKLTVDEKYSNDFEIIDRELSGNILESTFGKNYKSFYFTDDSTITVSEAIQKCHYGIISLHNSWTPKEYSALTTAREILNTDCLLSKIFIEILGFDFELPENSFLTK